jgi:hypothetical protein
MYDNHLYFNSYGCSYGLAFHLGLPSSTDDAITVPIDERFTGQELDGTGLYYCGVRYYDA